MHNLLKMLIGELDRTTEIKLAGLKSLKTKLGSLDSFTMKILWIKKLKRWHIWSLHMVFLVQYPWAAYDIFRGGDKLIISHEAGRNYVSPAGISFTWNLSNHQPARGGKCEMCWQDLYINKKKKLYFEYKSGSAGKFFKIYLKNQN